MSIILDDLLHKQIKAFISFTSHTWLRRLLLNYTEKEFRGVFTTSREFNGSDYRKQTPMFILFAVFPDNGYYLLHNYQALKAL